MASDDRWEHVGYDICSEESLYFFLVTGIIFLRHSGLLATQRPAVMWLCIF